MSFAIVNGAPQDINLGAHDMSIKPQPPKPITVSTHTSLCFGFAVSGPVGTKEYVDGGRLVALYGGDTFDRTLPYFTHGARMAEIVSSAGNALMFVRIIPEDNDTIANVTIYLDIIKDTIPVWKRNNDGSYAFDNDGERIKDKDITGYRIKVISEVNKDDILTPIGAKTSKNGYMKDKDGNVSTMIPVLEQRASYKGAKSNNYGFTITVPSEEDLRESIKDYNLCLPYEYGIVKRADEDSTGYFIKNTNGTVFDQFVFNPNGIDGLTGAKASFQNVVKKWYSTNDPLKDLVYPVLDKPYVYQKNLDDILGKLLSTEKAYYNKTIKTKDGSKYNTISWLDFVTSAPIGKQAGLLNPFTGLSSKRIPYFTFAIDDSVITLKDNHKEVYCSKSTPIYLGGGKDGTLTKENFEKGVSRYMEKFLDKNSEVMDPAINIENTLYDSGYNLPVKKDLVNFISVRKNTFLGLATHIDDGDKYKTLDEERAIGVVLKTRLALAPESTFFSTPVTRGIVVAGSGLDSLDPSNKRYTLLMDIVYKTARMMGGSKWNKNLLFDSGGKNLITNYSDIQPNFVPAGIKATLWNVGLIWPQWYDRSTPYWPAMQSVYDNDTSVLNNLFAAIALTVDNNVASAVWRKYTGTSSMPANEFIATIEAEANKMLDVFDGVINASAKAMITDYDDTNGFSWTLVSKLSGNVMKTVQVHYTEVYRNED